MPGTSSRNKPKSLSGIETTVVASRGLDSHAEINLNPYQGLKQKFRERRSQYVYAEINLNPYQGLKHWARPLGQFAFWPAEINLNPYQGLKQNFVQR